MGDDDLATWLQEHGPLKPAYALGLVSRICAALAAAGEVHGRLHPSAVLLRDAPEGLVPRLRDADAVRGSVAYTAPELHLGGTATERGDQYSLACMLWTCLTGTPPYDGTDLQVINAHITAPVPQLPGETLETEAINGVLSTALAKRPEQRFARGDAHDDSDLDLLVDLTPGQGNDLVRLAGLSEELSGLLGRRVDVVAADLLRREVSATALADAVAV